MQFFINKDLCGSRYKGHCPLKKADLHSLDFGVNRFCMKLFKTNYKEVIKACQEYFCFRLPSDLIETKKEEKLDSKYNNYSNELCRCLNRGKSSMIPQVECSCHFYAQPMFC